MPPKKLQFHNEVDPSQEWDELLNDETPVVTTVGCFMRSLVASIRTGVRYPTLVDPNQAVIAAHSLVTRLAKQGEIQQVDQLVVLHGECSATLHTDDSLSGPDDPTILPTSDTDPDPKKIH